jgi:Ca2+-transporting ATPase
MQLLGMSENLAKQRLEAEGPNDLPTPKARHPFLALKEILLDPMVSLLLGCGIIYFILGDQQEAILLLGFLGLIICITLFQERKTEKALQALRDLSSPRALVMREGQLKRIPSRNLVREDLLVLNQGDRIPADARSLSSTHLLVDESLLTGESFPAEKQPGENLLAGTLIVRGQTTAEVIAIGSNTAIGKIGKVLEHHPTEKTRLQTETRNVVTTLALVATGLCIVVVVAYGMNRHDWLGGFLAGLTLAMAIMPNELPAVLTIFMTLGAWRLSLRQVLTRKMAAIEGLGSATVLCVDKTGTLTLNQMSVQMLYSSSQNGCQLDLRGATYQNLPEPFHALVEFGILASSSAPFDPMEKALQKAGATYLSNTEHLHPDWRLTREYPLTSEMLAMSHVWNAEHQNSYIVGTKGAPEAIMDLCHLDEASAADVAAKVEEFAQQGLRVLGVAKATCPLGELPKKQHDYDFEFLGLLGLADPVRPHVPEAIQECYQAGVRVILITGDHAHTARSIAREIGLLNPDEVMTGPELFKMDEPTLLRRLKSVNCFARMMPEQKLRIVQSLKSSGEVVAMTGDGVNDAPALTTAQIGIAMGERGTDVARESAALVLLNDDFSSIVEAIRTGRRIFDNLRGAMAYLLAIHVPIAGISLLPVLFNLPLVLLPIHVAFLHLMIEPVCSVVFEAEPEASQVMRRKPRSQNQALFSRELILTSVIQGIVVFGIISGVYLMSIYRKQGILEARALTFTTLIFANLALVLVNRSRSRTLMEGINAPNKALYWVLSGGMLVLFLALYIPFLRELCGFAVLHPLDLLICFGAGILSITWFECWKLLQRKK